MFSVFILVQFFANQFGFDRDGFRVLILSPVQRRLILLGKNLACLPVAVTTGVVLLLIAAALLSPPLCGPGFTNLRRWCCWPGLAGNLLSILVPYRIQPGSMKP